MHAGVRESLPCAEGKLQVAEHDSKSDEGILLITVL